MARIRRDAWANLNLMAMATLVAVFANSADALQTNVVDPESLGFDKSILAEIDKRMQSAVDDGRMAGCSAMILKDDQVCYFRHWGMRDLEKQQPVEEDTIWRIYSMSKPITSVAAMQLVEKGMLQLDTPVSQYLPDLEGLKVLVEDDGKYTEVEPKREMTVRDLLRHTSGLTYGFFGESEVDKRYRRAGILMTNPDLAAMVGKLGELPLKHHPGTRFEYSASTDVLGYLVEVASGQRFDKYLQEHIFQPVGMAHTSFVVPRKELDRLSALYRPGRDGTLRLSPALSSRRFVDQENLFFSGGGGLCSTCEDYKQFCRMLLNGGVLNDHRIIEQATLEEMWTNQLEDLEQNSRRFQFGLGFSISPQGDYAWGGAAGTRFWVNPEKNLAIVFMVQINPYRERFGKEMREIVYRALGE